MSDVDNKINFTFSHYIRRASSHYHRCRRRNALKCVNHIHDDGYNSNRTLYIQRHRRWKEDNDLSGVYLQDRSEDDTQRAPAEKIEMKFRWLHSLLHNACSNYWPIPEYRQSFFWIWYMEQLSLRSSFDLCRMCAALIGWRRATVRVPCGSEEIVRKLKVVPYFSWVWTFFYFITTSQLETIHQIIFNLRKLPCVQGTMTGATHG